MLDEAHERSLQTDILMGLLKKIQRRRPTLRLVVASATLEARKFKAFFEANMPAVLRKPLPAVLSSTAAAEASAGAGAGAGAGAAAGTHPPRRRKSRWGAAPSSAGAAGPPAATVAPPPKPAAFSPVAIMMLEGRQFPVDVLYLETPSSNYVRSVVDTCVTLHTTMPPGDILAFLPASEDIDRAVTAIEDALPSDAPELIVRPLYAALPWNSQMHAVTPGRVTKGGVTVRKCVVATNIAETSVTIPGVVYVVDSGFVKVGPWRGPVGVYGSLTVTLCVCTQMPVYNPISGMESLLVQPVSKAQADQRKGRAGRVRSGKCFRLYTEAAFDGLQLSTPPEMVRTNLAPVALQLKALGISNLVRFEYMDPPPAEAMVRALELLYALGAVDDKCNLTEPLGRQMAEFPAEPRLAAMLLASLRLRCSEEALTVAACCSVKTLYNQARDRRRTLDMGLREYAVVEGDHLTMLNVYNGFLDNRKSPQWCGQHGFNYRALCRVSEIRRQLRQYLVRVAKEANMAAGGAGAGTGAGAGAGFDGSASKVEVVSCGDDHELVRLCGFVPIRHHTFCIVFASRCSCPPCCTDSEVCGGGVFLQRRAVGVGRVVRHGEGRTTCGVGPVVHHGAVRAGARVGRVPRRDVDDERICAGRDRH